jgi:hypothetical protein
MSNGVDVPIQRPNEPPAQAPVAERYELPLENQTISQVRVER